MGQRAAWGTEGMVQASPPTGGSSADPLFREGKPQALCKARGCFANCRVRLKSQVARLTEGSS